MRKTLGTILVLGVAFTAPALADDAEASLGHACSSRVGVEELHTFRGGNGQRVTCSTARRVVYRAIDRAYAGRGCRVRNRTTFCFVRVNGRRWQVALGPCGDGSWRLDAFGPQKRSLVAVVWP